MHSSNQLLKMLSSESRNYSRTCLGALRKELKRMVYELSRSLRIQPSATSYNCRNWSYLKNGAIVSSSHFRTSSSQPGTQSQQPDHAFPKTVYL